MVAEAVTTNVSVLSLNHRKKEIVINPKGIIVSWKFWLQNLSTKSLVEL